MNGWLLALRIARREAYRAKGRSALVIILIALPIVGLSAAAVTYDSFRLTTEQQLTRDLGAAQAVLTWRYDRPLVQDADGRRSLPAQVAEPVRPQPPVTAADVAAVLPPGSRVVPRLTDTLEMRTAAGVGHLSAEWLDLSDPVHTGRVELRAGRAPAAADEVALTRRATDRLGAGIGDRVHTADGERTLTVVGIAEYPYRFHAAVLLPLADAGIAESQRWLLAGDDALTWPDVQALNEHGILVRSRSVILDPPPLSELDPMVAVDDDAGNGDAIALGALVAGVAVVEVLLLAGPAFAVGARRRQRQLALVAAAGGTPAHQRRIVLADGVVLGAASATAGILLGAGAAVAALPLLEEHLMSRSAGGVRLFPLALLGTAALAVLTGLAAALIPAVTAARQHVLAALAGRRGQVRSRRRWLVVGLLATAAGVVTAVAGARQIDAGTMIAGLLLGQLGLVLCTPSLVGLVARVGRWLPLAPRVALRDTARNRAATAPAVSAVMAAVTGALALGIYLTADQQRNEESYQAGLPVGHAAVSYQAWDDDAQEDRRLTPAERDAVRTALAETLPAVRVQEVATPACPPGSDAEHCGVSVPVPEVNRCPAEDLIRQRSSSGASLEHLLSAEEQRRARQDPRCQEPWRGWSVYLATAMVDDGAALPALISGDRDDLAAARRVLDRGGVVVTDPRLVVDGRATLELRRTAPGTEQVDTLTRPAYVLTSGAPVPFVVLSPGALAQADLVVEPYGLVATTTRVPSQAEQDALRLALASVHPGLGAQVEAGGFASTDPFLQVFAAIAAVVALAAAGVATGLAAADRREDLVTLGAVGATPRVRRLLATSQSGVIAGLGALLGTLAGLGSAYAALIALNSAESRIWPPPDAPYPLVFPAVELALLLLVVPAVAMLGAGLLTRSRLPVERRSG